jgi:hypothetical protein
MKGIRRFTRGMVAGLMIGAISILILNPVDDKKRTHIRRSMGRAYKKFNGMIDNISDMW